MLPCIYFYLKDATCCLYSKHFKELLTLPDLTIKKLTCYLYQNYFKELLGCMDL